MNKLMNKLTFENSINLLSSFLLKSFVYILIQISEDTLTQYTTNHNKTDSIKKEKVLYV